MWQNIVAGVERTDANSDTTFELYDAGCSLAAIAVTRMSPSDQALMLATVQDRIGDMCERLMEARRTTLPRATNGRAD